MPLRDLKRAWCAALAALALPVIAYGANGQQAPGPGAESFTVFFRGTPVGSEQIAVTRSAEGWTIASTGRLAPPLDVVARRVQVDYDGNWNPRNVSVDANIRGQVLSIQSLISGTSAATHVFDAGKTADRTDTIPADALLLPSPFWGPFEAVAQKLKDAPAGTIVHAYAPGQPAAFDIRSGEPTTERIQTVSELVAARRTPITLMLSPVLEGEIWIDGRGRMLRLTVPSQGLDVIREDLGAVSSRRVTISRPNDEPLKIPSNGFSLIGTLSRPANAAPAVMTGKLPAVVLVGGIGPTDRDELLYGVPVLGQVAGALADAGFIVVRYDKRGVGQSGGRPESASFADYAEDVRAAVKVLSQRKDVDDKRIVVVGHGEGGAIALIAASKDKKIAGVALMGAGGVSGSDLVLAQQQRALSRLKLSPEEKQAKIDAQRRINDAAVSGKDLDKLPPDIRRQVDNAEFQSLLANDPAKVVPDVRQPILVLQGELDTQVDPSNADRLEALGKKRKHPAPIDVVKLPGLNHLFVTAKTGETDEYLSLPDKRVNASATQALVAWLQ
ncbi:MAG TPA: alpha/beta fold hydrolase, partial [Vicinamibacterales bacterium]|nr:alpha/beta fold hydrolase [Vicinamibacterales bacterium]